MIADIACDTDYDSLRLGEMMKNAHRDDNPNGIISLGVAENSLMVR